MLEWVGLVEEKSVVGVEVGNSPGSKRGHAPDCFHDGRMKRRQSPAQVLLAERTADSAG